MLYKPFTVTFRVTPGIERAPRHHDVEELTDMLATAQSTVAEHILVHGTFPGYPDLAWVERTKWAGPRDYAGRNVYELRTAVPDAVHTDNFMAELADWFVGKGWQLA